MAAFTSAAALAASQQRRFGLVQRSVRVAHKEMAHHMAGEAIDLTSGTVSTRTLRKLWHPFSRGKARSRGGVKKALSAAGISKLPINRQSGKLQRSLRIIPERTASSQTYRIQFTAPHAKFVLAPGGTKRMVARGFWPEMRKRWQPRNKRLIYDIRLRQLQIMLRKG